MRGVRSFSRVPLKWSEMNLLSNKTLDQCIAKCPGFSYTIVESSSDVEKPVSILLEGMIIESKNEAATKELLNMFRFTDWESSTVTLVDTKE